jgi:hypothetical protein
MYKNSAAEQIALQFKRCKQAGRIDKIYAEAERI